MIIVEVFADGIREPIRFACFNRYFLSGSACVVISDDEAVGDFPRYILHVSRRETDVDSVSNFYQVHNRSNGKGGGVSLAEEWDAIRSNDECSSLGSLTPQELLFPLVIDELRPYKGAIDPHRYN